MEVAYAILANYVEYSPEGRLYVVSGDMENLLAPGFPLDYSFVLALRLLFAPEECGREYQVRVQIEGADALFPDGRRGAPPITALVTPALDASHPNRRSPVVGRFLLQSVSFPRAGAYPIRISINEQEVKVVDLTVDQAPPASLES